MSIPAFSVALNRIRDMGAIFVRPCAVARKLQGRTLGRLPLATGPTTCLKPFYIMRLRIFPPPLSKEILPVRNFTFQRNST